MCCFFKVFARKMCVSENNCLCNKKRGCQYITPSVLIVIQYIQCFHLLDLLADYIHHEQIRYALLYRFYL